MKSRHSRLGLLLVLACCGPIGCSNGGANADRATQQTTEAAALNADTRLRLAEAAEAGGDQSLAARLYGNVHLAPGSSVDLQLKVADGLARNGRIAGAEEVLKQALQANPTQPDLLRALALVHIVSGRPELALGELDRALAARPGDQRSIVDKAVALDMLQRPAEAQALYRQALAKAPDDADIRTDLGMSLMLEGRVQEAASEVAPLRNSQPPSDRVGNNIEVISAVGGDDTARSGHDAGLSSAMIIALRQHLPPTPTATASAP